EAGGEQVRRRLAVGPGQPEVVARVAAQGVRGDDEEGYEQDPGAEDDPFPPGREHAEPVKTPGHLVEASALAADRLGPSTAQATGDYRGFAQNADSEEV